MAKKTSKASAQPKPSSLNINALAQTLVDTWVAKKTFEAQTADQEELSVPQLKQLLALNIRLEEGAKQAWDVKQLKPLLAAIDDLCEHHALGEYTPTYFELQETLSQASYSDSFSRLATNTQGQPVSVRPVLLGIPVSGALSDFQALLRTSFVSLIRKHGWVPDSSNVQVLGLLTADDAIRLSQDVLTCWRLVEQIQSLQHGQWLSPDYIPGLIDFQDSEPSTVANDTLRLGGYVILVAAYCAQPGHEGVQLLAFDELEEELDDAQEEALIEAWLKDCKTLMPSEQSSPAPSAPDHLSNAARIAVVEQWMMSLYLGRSMETQQDAGLTDLCFLVDEAQQQILLAGRFDDGHTETIRALPMDGAFLIESLLDFIDEDVVVHMTSVKEGVPWDEKPVFPISKRVH